MKTKSPPTTCILFGGCISCSVFGQLPLSMLPSFRLYTYCVHICKISSADANGAGDRFAQLPSGPLCGCQGSAVE